MTELIQEIIGTVLFFVFAFGIGFILNMLIKTTWFPMWFYIVVVLPISVWYLWKPDLTFLSFLGVFLWPLVAVVGGGWASGWAIKTLRKNGYGMF